MIEASTLNGTLLFGYDINGIRTSRSEGGITTNFVVDHNQQYAQVLAEIENGVATKQYTYGDDLLSQADGTGQERFFLNDGLGTTRALADGSEVVTDTYAYEAFGELLASTGSSDNAYRYTGEQYDFGLDQYYLRARYYDQGVGRFTQMDTWAGVDVNPITLNKYVFGNSDPVINIDPTGNYSQSFGFKVEEEVEDQYKMNNRDCEVQIPAVARNCLFGGRAYFSAAGYLKPDIMDYISKSFNEIKPLSPSGIASGKVKIRAYSAIYGSSPFNMHANTDWTPATAVVDGTLTYFRNIDGLIFYTDDERVKREITSATLATLAVITKNAVRNMSTRLGGGAAARAGINIAMNMRVAQSVLMPPAMAIQRF